MTNDRRQVEIEEGVAFGRGSGRDLLCDVYRPPALEGPATGVLLLFGGGWQGGERSQLRGYGILHARDGFVCVCADYRLTAEAQWPAQLHDVKAAIRWMRANAAGLGIDPERIVVQGNSAGGQLALLAAATAGRPELEGEGGNPGVASHVAAVSAIYPVTLFEPAVGDAWQVALSLVPPGRGPELLAEASPLNFVRAGLPPVLLVHGTADTTVVHEQSVRMFDALLKAGVPVDLHLYAGQRHAFDQTREFAREVAALTQGFFRRYAGAPSS